MIPPKFILPVLLFGCAHYPPLVFTPRYSIPVHLDVGVVNPESTILSWIDLRGDEWIAHKDDWGCSSFSDQRMGELMRLEPVIVHPGFFLSDGGYMGFNTWSGNSPKIDVTEDYPALRGYYPYDPAYVNQAPQDSFDYSYGLRQLPHEWTHTARGAWHP